jgi:carbon monoxide dehydrogenase subunit G
MLLWLAASLAFADPSRWANRDPDVSATATIQAPPAAIHAVLMDPHVLERLFPPECASDYDYTDPKDARAVVRLTYHAAMLHRRLDAMAPVAKAANVVEVEHLGNKGFYTQWALKPGDDGTEVQMTTYLQPPPWPFRRYYYAHVRPAWVQCHVEALDQLANLAREAPVSADSPAP